MDLSAKTRVFDLQLIGVGNRDLYHALYSSSEVMRAIGPPLESAKIDAQFERVLRHNQLITPGHRAWAILERDSREKLGLAALLRNGAAAELGIMLLPAAWRRGIASGALRTLLSQAFGDLGLERIEASRAADDHAFVIDRLLLPLGFEPAVGLRSRETGWALTKPRWATNAKD